jgi:hypothetical protein
MTAQTTAVLVLAALGLLYLLRDALGSAFAGGCASGCGRCKSGGCPVRKLEALGTEPDRPSKRSA